MHKVSHWKNESETRKVAMGFGAQDNGTGSSLRGREESCGIAGGADLCKPG